MDELKGKTALITGGSQGIGKSIAVAMAKEGANIIINDIEPAKEGAEATVAELKALGVEAASYYADVSNFEAVKAMVEEIKKTFPNINILVNNAGITKDRTLKKMTPEEWNSVISINLNSVYNVTHNVLEMIPEGGSIISLSSIAGVGGNFGQCNYASTKAGIIGFTKSLAKELGKQKITVNAIAPGFIKSKMTDKIPMMMLDQILSLIPSKEMGQPEDVANLAVFLASSKGKYISSQVIRVDGGMMFG
ncbi:MAG: 3-oxoacyl-ACP reductase FabG [Nanoarchaeota archaeon]|nr:3-oxoacyl-ACP reductase FabG [Nanoarchaeota archaeon]MBU1704636.1 3-oxoacyl-ACP reductase FabG [Nanoarchaeota archaeon]